MQSDASGSATGETADPDTSIKLRVLPLVYGVATASTVIVAAMYGVAGEFFLEVGETRAAAVLGLAVIGTLALAGASLAATVGLLRRAGWAWYLAVAIAGIWTANGVRVLLKQGFYLPASLVIGLVVAWALWDERAAFGIHVDVT